MMGISLGNRISKRIWSLFVGNRRMSSSSSSRMFPWLVLKPQRMNDDMIYKFYSLEEEKVVKWNKRSGGGGGEEPADVSKIVGSSHGWLALFNESNNELFLSDPLNRKHIRLPGIEKLPDPEMNLIEGRGTVSKLILSCSPDHDGVEGKECRALISYGAGDRLAFCSPLSSTHWLPIGDLLLEHLFTDDCLQGKPCSDFVYCAKRKVFSCLTPSLKITVDESGICQDSSKYECQLEELDLSPQWVHREILPSFFINEEEEEDDKPVPSWMEKNWPIQTSHLVYAEESDELYVLVRLIDGSPPVPYDRIFSNSYSINDPYVIAKYEQDFPYRTVGFVALRFDDDRRNLAVASSLDGLAMFVGVNHSFAISASKYPELNLMPNSIYFTDVGSRIKGRGWSGSDEYEGRDVGIFDYQNNLVLPWYNKTSMWVQHAPLWFTPNNVNVD